MKARIAFLLGFLAEMLLGISLGSLVTFGFSFWTLHFTSFPNGNLLANLIAFSGFIGILATAISGEGKALLAQLFLGLVYVGAVALNNVLIGLVGFVGILWSAFSGIARGTPSIEAQDSLRNPTSPFRSRMSQRESAQERWSRRSQADLDRKLERRAFWKRIEDERKLANRD